MTWQVSSFAVLALVLAAGFGWYERRRPPARIVALVAALAALAVVGRLAFAAIPNVKPTTDIVLFAGYALGPLPGFVVGAVAALASNVFLGQGTWTAWQMVAWGGVGVGGGLLARAARGRELGRVPLALACAAAGLAFGAFMDVYQWTLAAEQTLASYVALSATSLPYNVAHVIGNVAFCLLIGPAFIRALRRYRRRFEVRWVSPAPVPTGAPAGARGAAAVALVALVLAAGVGAASDPAVASAASPSAQAARYLERAQNRDGGFGGARGQSSSDLFSGWSALGLAAAGRNPRDVARRGGRAITTYLRRAGSLEDTGELERTILVLRAAGLSPRRFAGRDLVSRLLARRRGDGSWRGNVAHTAFGVLALRAAGLEAGSGAVRLAADWLERARNGDGGFGFVASAESDVDDTGAVMQALVAAGRRAGGAVRGAVAYLRGTQNSDGGFGQMAGRSSNAQSTAWAVQGLVAADVRPGSLRRGDPIRYLVGLQRGDGHIAYSRASDQTPVWVTAQALTALRRKPFPLATVPRAAKRRRAGDRDRRGAAGGAAKADGDRDGSRGARLGRGRDGGRRGAEPSGGGGSPSAGRSLLPPSTGATSERPAAGALNVDRTGGEGEGNGDSLPAGLILGAVGGALVGVWLLRRRLRGRWPAAIAGRLPWR